MKRFLVSVGSVLLLVGAGAATLAILKVVEQRAGPSITSTPAAPQLVATVLVDGLDHPWDIDFLPDDSLIFSERSGQLSLLKDGERTIITAPSDVRATGEGGMMGLAVDPDYAKNSFIYTCYNTEGGDVKVVRWTLTDGTIGARRDIVSDIPANDSGRHSGCQVAFGPDGNLWVGTGDAADEDQPQDRNTLGGKILRVTKDGGVPFDNPEGPDKRIWSYGHRNVQSLAFYPKAQNGSYGLSVEHGPDKDDELNQLVTGNFGWAPGDGYDESVPMTDLTKFRDAEQSVWSSGSSTIAASGAAFLRGSEWGRLDGWLAVTALKGQKLKLLNVTNGSVGGERDELVGKFGRLRAATLGPDEKLYVSTDNGSDDKIIAVSPPSD